MKWKNSTIGEMTFEDVILNIKSFINEDDNHDYNIVIGTDSQSSPKIKKCRFITAIIVHRIGKGGRYFYRAIMENKKYGFQDRMYQEAMMSIETANTFIEQYGEDLFQYNIQIHLDVGHNGKTREVIKSIVGMVNGYGFEAIIKPFSYGASNVADKHSKFG